MKTKLLLALAVVVAIPVGAMAHPDIKVTPTAYDFGDVEVGNSSTVIVNIANVGTHPLTIMIVAFNMGSSPDFSVTSAPSVPFTINPPYPSNPNNVDNVDVEITFAPSAEGAVSAGLKIVSDDPDEGTVTVLFSGAGVESEPPPDYTSHLNFIEISPGIVWGDTRYGTAFIGRATGDLSGTSSVMFCYTPPHPGPGVVNEIQGGEWSLSIRYWFCVVGRLSGNLDSGTAVWDADGNTAEVTAIGSITRATGVCRGMRGTMSFNGTLSHESVIPRLTGDLGVFLDE